MVRIYPKDKAGKKDKSRFIDVEVLDAVAFTIERGKQVVLDMPAKKAVPYIVDKTDADQGKQPGKKSATRRTHVEKLKGDDGAVLYVEVFDAAAYRDVRGEEWILTSPDNSPYDKTDDTGADGATRRCHDEKLSASKPSDHNPKSNFITVQRTDMLAFRSVRGKEVIIKMPSADDESADRAKTFISNMPDNTYDPTSDDPDKAPPENEDPHFYVKFDPKGASPLLGKTKIKQGPFWWIRRVKMGGDLLFITLDVGGFQGSFNINGTSSSLNPFDGDVKSAVQFTSDSADVKLLAYYNGALEFTAADETLVFEIPPGDFNIQISARDPMAGNATAAIYKTEQKAGLSIYRGEAQPDGQSGVARGAPKNLAGTDPQEVDPSSIDFGFPSNYVMDGNAQSQPTSINGVYLLYGLDSPGVYADVESMGKDKDKKKAWTRTTKFYKPGIVDGYETVIPYGDGLDTTHNGTGVTWTMYVTNKNGKLKISNTAPPGP